MMRTVRWRRTWWQVHKLIGLLLAILILPLSLSGAALVWHDALDRALHPGRFASTGAATLAPDRYAFAAAAVAGPGERVAQLTLPQHRGPVVVALAPASVSMRAGPPRRRMVWLDGPSARVLDSAWSDRGLVRFLHVLHGSLQIPGWGRTVVGLIGIAMMLSALTGLWLWWPLTGSVARGFRWRRRPHLEANIHHSAGFWIAVPLFVLSLTGAWISFPAVFGGQTRPPARSPVARPVAATRLTAEEAVAKAAALLPGPVRTITWPTERKPDWSVQIGDRRGRAVSVADDEGIAALARTPTGSAGTLWLVRGIHEGSVGGPLWQVVVFLGGLVPAVLAVTGVIMWWRTRTVRQRTVARSGTRHSPPPAGGGGESPEG